MTSNNSIQDVIDTLEQGSYFLDHTIEYLYTTALDLKGSTPEIYAEIPSQPNFRIHEPREFTNTQLKNLRIHIPYLLSKNYIIKTNKTTNWCVPPVVIKKKDGEIIMPLNYRRLNEVTKKDNYRLISCEDIVDKMCEYKLYSKFPIKGGFYGIPLSPESREKTTFYVDGQQYMFRVLPMGYMNGHIIFQRTLDSILSEEIGKGKCLVHSVDVYVFGNDPFWHYRNVMNVVFNLCGEGIELDWDETELAHRSLYYCYD